MKWDLQIRSSLVDQYKLDERFKDTVFFVEATDYEVLCLWQKYHLELNWKDDLQGKAYVVKSPYNKPITLVLKFATIFNQRICFFNAPSELVDWEYIDTFFAKAKLIPVSCGRLSKTNADNFHLCWHFCKENRSFIDKCLTADATLDEVDKYVDKWHLKDTGTSLCDYLGMTQEEYNNWVCKPSSLKDIIEARKA